MDDRQNKSRFQTDLTGAAEAARAYRPDRHVASFVASIVAHAALIGMLLYFAPSTAKTHSDWVLAYLVERGDSGSRGSGAEELGASAKPAPTSAETGPIAIENSTAPRALTPTAMRASQKIDHSRNRNRQRMTETSSVEVASKEPMVSPASARDARAPIKAIEVERGQSSPAGASRDGVESPSLYDSATGLDPNRAGVGDGAGASEGGGSIAHADYSKNPPPVYPASARRRAQQGTVTLHVLVGADGSVVRAEIAESSGFEALDDAALESVRARWKFIAARRAGVTFESWVLVPIRFALTEANASR